MSTLKKFLALGTAVGLLFGTATTTFAAGSMADAETVNAGFSFEIGTDFGDHEFGVEISDDYDDDDYGYGYDDDDDYDDDDYGYGYDDDDDDADWYIK